MKYFLLILLLTSSLHAAETYPGGDPDKNEALEDAPGSDSATPEEQEERRIRSQSMGGAPNVGTGVSTGTGAGSTVGNKIDEVDDSDEVRDSE